MEPKTAQELMEIQSTFEGEPATESEFSCDAEESGKVGDQRTTFKRPISCSFCGKAFTAKSKLEIHERFHTGEKPFSCSKCDKKFFLAGALKTHERIHTNEKPYSCSKCDKKFTTSSSLRRHERTHDK